MVSGTFKIFKCEGAKFAVGNDGAYLFSSFLGCWVKTPNFETWSKHHSVKPTGETITKQKLSGITR